MAPGLPLRAVLTRSVTQRDGGRRMGFIERCLIWGEDPETRRRLGAGADGCPEPTLQGTAATAAVPHSSSAARVDGARRSPLVPALLTLALLCAAGADARAQGSPDVSREGLSAPPGGPQ